MSKARPRVALLTTHWGGDDTEEGTITRLFAGALSLSAEVEIVHFDTEVNAPTRERDSLFALHRLPLCSARPLRAGLIRVALAAGGPPRPLTPTLEELVLHEEGHVVGLEGCLEAIGADALVLAGIAQPYDLTPLRALGLPVLVLPMLGALERAGEARTRRVLSHATTIATIGPGERDALLALFPERAVEIVDLDVALALNRAATSELLFGVHWFGRYVLLLRAFPPGSPRYEQTITRELLSSLLGVSVAEIDGETFKVSDDENTVELPVNSSRVNLWRLMAHAEATVDVRPPGPFGQECIESLLLGTPVVVPAGSAAHAIATASGGGLGYAETGELVAAVAALLEPGERARRAEAGRAWAEQHHGGRDRFIEAAARLALGGDQPTRSSSSAAMPSRMSDSE